VRDAQAHADEDKQRRELADLRNQTDTAAYGLEKLLSENRAKLSDTQASEIEDAVKAARKAIEGDDASALRSAQERVTNLSHQVAASLYQSAPADAGAPPQGGEAQGAEPPRSGDDVVDAEYTVKE
jgi:molecular chaperone DnaK